MREMKKKVMVLMLVGMLALVFSVGNAMAAPPWYVCTISEAGTTEVGYSWVTLTDTATPAAFTNTIFIIPDANVNAKGEFAAALTAVANSSNVRVLLMDPTAGAPCTGICVIK